MDWTAPEVFNTGFNRLLGIELVECRKGAATVRMRVTDACKNPAGIVHGGALFSLARIQREQMPRSAAASRWSPWKVRLNICARPGIPNISRQKPGK